MPLVIMGGINNLGAREPTAASRVVDPVQNPGPTVRVRMGEGADQRPASRCAVGPSSLRPLLQARARGDQGRRSSTTGGRDDRAHGPGAGPGRDRPPPHARPIRGSAASSCATARSSARAPRSRPAVPTPRSRPCARPATAPAAPPCTSRSSPARTRAAPAPCVDALIEAGVDPRRGRARGPRPAASPGRASPSCATPASPSTSASAPTPPPARSRRTCITAAPAAPSPSLKTAMSLDGRIAAADGSSQWITGAAARADAHELRADSQAIVVGAGTALADQPAPHRARRRRRRAERQPLRVAARRPRPRARRRARCSTPSSRPRSWSPPTPRPTPRVDAWRAAGAKVRRSSPRRRRRRRRPRRDARGARPGTACSRRWSRAAARCAARCSTRGLADRLVVYVAPDACSGATAARARPRRSRDASPTRPAGAWSTSPARRRRPPRLRARAAVRGGA